MREPFDFGTTLRELRRSKGYTQKRLAGVLNVSETTISKYESNIAVPPFETIRAIAAWFNISLDALAGNEPPLTASLHGLDDKQSSIIKSLIAFYNEKNSCSAYTFENKRYELLGRITESLI